MLDLISAILCGCWPLINLRKLQLAECCIYLRAITVISIFITTHKTSVS